MRSYWSIDDVAVLPGRQRVAVGVEVGQPRRDSETSARRWAWTAASGRCRVAQSSGTSGSITTFEPAGTWRHHPGARQVARVGPRQDHVVVDHRHEALSQQQHARPACPPTGAGTRGRGQPADQLDRAVGGEDRDDREDRHQPAAEEPLLIAHEDDERDRRRQQRQHHRDPPPHDQQHRAADRGDRRAPPEAPGERPQVVRDPAAGAACRASPGPRRPPARPAS